MVVGHDGKLPLPWLQATLDAAMAQERAHALLLRGSADVGALEAAVVLAQSWLCEGGQGGAMRIACGRCEACHLVQARSHPDLLLLLTEEMRQQHGWLMALDKAASAASSSGDDDKPRKKASRQIRIDEVRWCNEWASKTSSRGRAKVVVLHPADVLNVQAANALLKTLEEPSPGVRFVLTTADADALLPTVRSRCQMLSMPAPDAATALAWLRERGVEGGAVLLAAAGERPLLALSLHAAGVSAQVWAELPLAVARGDAKVLSGWPLPRAIDALLRLCHDLARQAVGGAPRFFPAAAIQIFSADAHALDAWRQSLLRASRHDGHAWNEGLLLESLCAQGAMAMDSGNTAVPGRRATLPA